MNIYCRIIPDMKSRGLFDNDNDDDDDDDDDDMTYPFVKHFFAASVSVSFQQHPRFLHVVEFVFSGTIHPTFSSGPIAEQFHLGLSSTSENGRNKTTSELK